MGINTTEYQYLYDILKKLFICQKREREKAIKDIKRVAEEAKNIKDKNNAAPTLQEIDHQQHV